MTRTRNLPLRARARKPLERKAVIYLAAPKTEYPTARYRRLATLAKERFPGAELIEARTAFVDICDWRERWPHVLRQISALVFCTTPDGWIGRGVWTEIDTARHGVPVHYLTEGGALVPYDRLSFSHPNPDHWTRHVQVTIRKAGPHAA